jgi:hypothetical protein
MKLLYLAVIFIALNLPEQSSVTAFKPPLRLLPKERQAFTIPLDANSYKEKWRDVIKEYKPFMQATIKPLVLSAMNVNDALLKKFANLVSFYSYMPEFIAEIKAIAELSEIDYPTILAYNLVYEYFAYCTSTITQDANGNILHGRNLDYDFTKEMGPLFVDANFTRNGTLVHQATFLVGYVGHTTGMRRGKFAISVNQRKTLNGSINDNIFEMFHRGAMPMSWLVRRTLENATSWTEAVDLLSNKTLAAPVYFIVSGTRSDEGVIISRGRESVHDIEYLDIGGMEDKWLLVQTNSDRDWPYKEYRKEMATKRIKEIGKTNINAENLFSKVLNIYPNFNSLTIFVNVMSAQSGIYNTTFVF